jgi:hypothetical protein
VTEVKKRINFAEVKPGMTVRVKRRFASGSSVGMDYSRKWQGTVARTTMDCVVFRESGLTVLASGPGIDLWMVEPKRAVGWYLIDNTTSEDTTFVRYWDGERWKDAPTSSYSDARITPRHWSIVGRLEVVHP